MLIEVFKDTFKPSEADLIVLSSPRAFPKLPEIPQNIIIRHQWIELNDLIKLYVSCHAFVLPTKGEGWGLPFTEAGAMGLPIIATNWGAQTEFLDDRNSFLLRIDGLMHPPKEIDKDPENLFANPSRDDLTWENSAQIISERLASIAGTRLNSK